MEAVVLEELGFFLQALGLARVLSNVPGSFVFQLPEVVKQTYPTVHLWWDVGWGKHKLETVVQLGWWLLQERMSS